MPTSGPKSISRRIAGLRAPSSGAAATTVPTRMSTRSKSSMAISAGSPTAVRHAVTVALRRALVDELEAEAALDAEVALGHRRVERRGDLDDPVVLDVELDRAADAAVRADRVGHGLRRLVPGARLAHVVLGLEHERAGRADADAVAAVDAGATRAAGRPARSRSGRRSRARRPRSRTCSGRPRRRPRRTCSRGCTSSSRGRRGRCRSWSAGRRSRPRRRRPAAWWWPASCASRSPAAAGAAGGP